MNSIRDRLSIAFIHKVFPCSGAEQVTIDLANYLCRQGYCVTILAINHREASYPAGTERLFDVKVLPKGNIKSSRKVAHSVCNLIQNERIDILITYRELLYARWLKKQTGVKMVFELHNTPYYEFLDLADKRRENRWKNIFYGCGIEWLLRLFYKSKYRRVYGWCDAYGVLCDSYRQELISHLSLDQKNNKVWVLPNSIKPAKHIILDKEKVVLYVGRLTHRDKRVDRLLRIWRRVQESLPDWQLKIVGSGKAAPQLKMLAASLALKRCSFEGYSTHVNNYYNEASILCLTSSFEGWPMCIAEAQANGVIPIVFNSFSGAADQISQANEGILVTPYDEEAFARQLIALATDEVRLTNIRQAVIQKAQTYSIVRSGQAWEKMFHHILDASL